ncbi:MAG: restriction endonuclease subunit S [Magnetospirillum gryphiswaldense]|nr:restriction endonuclease subunit S [Magnetospirillum gryphiswaldense]
MTIVSRLFNVEYGSKFDMNKMEKACRETGIAFVGRRGGLTGFSGVSGYVAPVPGVSPFPAGNITVALGGSRLLSSYVQQRPFYTAQNVAVLTPIDESMHLKHRLFYAMCIKHNDFRYTAFGREANRTLGTIELPDEVPSWVDDVELPTHEGLARALAMHVPLRSPSEVGWLDFSLEDLFEVKKGRRLTKADRSPGTTRFIGATEKNNGITDRADIEPIFPAGTLTVVYNGNSVGSAFYQNQEYFACDDVNVLVPKHPMSQWVQLFISATIKHGRSRFTYGYKWTLARMKVTKIRLPVDMDGCPDWAYMESFMKGLPFSAAIDAAL